MKQQAAATKAQKEPKEQAEVNARRQELIDAAAFLFASRGFEATTMRDIAAHVGKTPGALYYHFASKDDLLVAVHAQARKWGETTFQDVQASADPWERLEKICVAHMEAVLERPDYAAVVCGYLPSDDANLRRQLVGVRDDWEKRFRELIDALPVKSESDKKYIRLALLGAMNYSQVWFKPNRERPRAIARKMVELIRYRLID